MWGEFPDTVIGMPDSRTEVVMLRPPGGRTGLERRASSAQATSQARPAHTMNWGCAQVVRGPRKANGSS